MNTSPKELSFPIDKDCLLEYRVRDGIYEADKSLLIFIQTVKFYRESN